MEFPKFWYESNACWGYVNSFEELADKVELQLQGHSSIASVDDFLDSSYQSKHDALDFGTRREHTELFTLREFLTEQGVIEEFLTFYNTWSNDNHHEYE
jgi:hypothetical protein